MSTPIYNEVVRDAATGFFFDGAARGEFLLFRCRACQQHGGPQEIQCPHCGSPELEVVAAARTATLVSWIVLHEADPNQPGATRRKAVAVGELAEGPWWWATVVGADPDSLREGQPLTIGFGDVVGGEKLPVFEVA